MMVLCPLCNQRVNGEGETELSLNLQAHMASAHDFKEICQLEDAEALGNKGACAPSASGELADLPYGERRVEEAHRPEGILFPGEDVMESVRCPVCGNVLLGHAFDDLSHNLAKHMNSAHSVRVAWQGKG
jgi:hypothetical protein